MTKELAIKILSTRDRYGCLCGWTSGYTEALDMAVEALKERPYWIPCSERLPEPEKKIYWVCTDSGYQCQCRWTNVNHFWTNLTTDWHWHIMDVPQYSEVIAWKLLPKPWKGESNEND